MKRLWIVLTMALWTALLSDESAVANDVVPLQTGGDGIEKIDAIVAGRHGTFLFDSGIGASAITPRVAAAIGCKPWGKVTGFRATGERVDTPRCNAVKVMIGNATTSLSQISVLDLARFMGSASDGLSGVIGLDALAGQVVTIDIAHHELTIEDSGSLAEICRTATPVPVRFVRDAQGAALTVDMGLGTSSGLVWMELDTGNYGPSLVDKSIAAPLGLDPASPAPQQWTLPLQGDRAVTVPAIVKDMILDGNLGRNVLVHWLVTLDLARGRGWIRVNKP